MEILSIVSRIASLFIIMAIGFIMNKAGILDKESDAKCSKLVLNITVPAQIITAFVSNRGMLSTGEIFGGFGLSATLFPIYMGIGMIFILLCKVPKDQRGTYSYMSMFSNVGFMGYPVITTIFGEEAMICAVINNVIYNIWCFSLGIILIGGSDKKFQFNPKVFLNIPLIASVLSIGLYFVGIDFPEPLMVSMEYLGDVTTPVAMLVLGSSIASMPVRKFFDDWRMYIFTVVRLLVIPMVIFLYLRIVPGASSLIKGTYLVLSAMPVATSATMMAIEHGGDVDLASKGIFFSTVFSVLTIPVMAILCQYL